MSREPSRSRPRTHRFNPSRAAGGLLRALRGLGALFVLVVPLDPAAAQTCFVYSDTEPALAPITCVNKTTLLPPCSYGNLNSPNDCTVVPAAPGSQTILQMHTIWHQCFGNVGGPVPPDGRSQRWYAFHRQFEHDFNRWRDGIGFPPIESLDWCPNMDLPHGTGPALAVGDNPAGCTNIGNDRCCGIGTERPDHRPCPTCTAFPQCLFLPGAGPIDCPGAPAPDCETPDASVSFPAYDSLDDFANVDEVSKILDGQFHGIMHGAVGIADRVTCNPNAPTPATCYNLDSLLSRCSPRDPMFWRLHKALDDVVRAWQDSKAADVVLVIDRSGSMNGPDASGTTKWQAALDAVDNFGDLMADERPDGAINRVGIVSFSNTATIELGMTDADSNLRNVGSPFELALNGLSAGGPGGCTGIAAGIQKALELLCPPGDCQGFIDPDGHDRKGILLLTDGVENVAPCLNPAGPAGASCGGQCFGAQLDYDKLEFTQLVAVGFGDEGSLNGDVLTLLAERQGGIYMQNPNDPGDDLKLFFTKAFGKLTDEFPAVDPSGLLAANAAATEPVEYPSCGDRRLTFASGWQKQVPIGDLRLMVETPAGNLVPRLAAEVESSRDLTWEFSRIPLPYRGENPGTWRAQIIRPHRAYVNGVAPDSFTDPAAGTRVVRRQIQRLCPEGCAKVLYFEGGRRGSTSVYERALAEEVAAKLLDGVTVAATPVAFATELGKSWDLVVYARMGANAPEPYDSMLISRVCGGQRAILTDSRPQVDQMYTCLGMARDGSTNWSSLTGDGRLFAGSLAITNPGHAVASYGLRASTVAGPPPSAQATASSSGIAVAARIASGLERHWYVNVLTLGLSKLDVYHRALDQKTGDQLVAMARMLPSYIPAGGFDQVDARVEVDFPRIGFGTLITQSYSQSPATSHPGETFDRRADTASKLVIPRGTATFPLYDDGTHGDLYPRNANWTGELNGLGATDGMYHLRYVFDLTRNGCTTRRELAHSVFVDVQVKPESSQFRVRDQVRRPNGGYRTTVNLRPADAFGNLWGPGRASIGGCEPKGACTIDPRSVVDHDDGSYSLAVDSVPGVAGVRLTLMGAVFDLPLPCTGCPRLSAVQLDATRVKEHSFARATVRLDAPAPDGGAVVFLASSNPEAAVVPASITVPAGAREVEFEVAVHHAHGAPAPSTLSARYGGTETATTLTVVPLQPGNATARSSEPPSVPVKAFHGHIHDEEPVPAASGPSSYEGPKEEQKEK